MVNHSTNINKTKNYLSLQIIKHWLSQYNASFCVCLCLFSLFQLLRIYWQHHNNVHSTWGITVIFRSWVIHEAWFQIQMTYQYRKVKVISLVITNIIFFTILYTSLINCISTSLSGVRSILSLTLVNFTHFIVLSCFRYLTQNRLMILFH